MNSVYSTWLYLSLFALVSVPILFFLKEPGYESWIVFFIGITLAMFMSLVYFMRHTSPKVKE